MANTYHFILLLTGLILNPVSLPANPGCSCSLYEQLKAEGRDDGFIIQQLEGSSGLCGAKVLELQALRLVSGAAYDSAEFFLERALALYDKSNCGMAPRLLLHKTWAGIWYARGDFPRALEQCLKLRESAAQQSDRYEQANCLTMIAQLFNQMGQADKGITYVRQAIALNQELKDPEQRTDLAFKISKRYLWYYQDLQTPGSLDTAESFARLHLLLARKLNDSSAISNAFNNLQGMAYERSDLNLAIRYLDSSMAYIQPGNPGSTGTNYYDRSDIQLEMGNYAEALRLSDSSIYYHTKSGHAAYIAEAYDLRSRVAQAAGLYTIALDAAERSRNIRDSIDNAEKTAAINELEQKYNQAKNEQTINGLARQKRIYLLLAITGLLIAAITAIFIRQRGIRQRQRILETEQRLNRARMNPHFFFNALASLQAFALRENDGIAVARNLGKFSHIMRDTLESTFKEYVTIEQECDFLREYLELQQIRYPDKFSYSIGIDAGLEPQGLLIPSMIIQPFAENSIEHGFAGIDYPGRITLQFSRTPKEVIICLHDNGRGFSTKQKSPDHISRASQIIRDRIYLLNIRLKTHARFSLENNPEGHGIKVVIYLPAIEVHEHPDHR